MLYILLFHIIPQKCVFFEFHKLKIFWVLDIYKMSIFNI
jgi:hypothetical protein